MTTIEPRLIALLNNDALSDSSYTTFLTSPSLELPPLHDPNILKASGRPLLLEPDASKRDSKLHTNLISPVEEASSQKASNVKKRPSNLDRALGNSSPQSLRKILDHNDDPRNSLAVPSKKRNIVENGKDEFVQLPQPPKKQKAAKQVVPPIIIGLFEPPPQAALFPPIASSSFHDSHGRNSLNTVSPKIKELKDESKLEDNASTFVEKKSAVKQKPKRDMKARKKWTEEETNNLLLGVHRHGVGRWTDILEDPSFSFNGRSGVDLKDRFRTCCPDELRKNPPEPRSPSAGLNAAKKLKSSLLSENILIEEDDDGLNGNGRGGNEFSTLRKSRAHRKKLEDLAELGIDGPFRKSQRRERRPFTEQDDHEILSGYQLYGPAWSRIQRDPRFHLQSRQATDLRDRFRNKFPEKFRPEDATSKDLRKPDVRDSETSTVGLVGSTPHPSTSRESLKIHQIITENETAASNVLPSNTQMSNFNFRDFASFSDQSTEPTDGIPTFDWPGNAPFTESIGEMDISRLLLDEPWMDNSRSKGKQSFTDINSILTSTTDELPQVSTYYGILVNDEQIGMPSSVALDHDSSFG